MQFTTPLSILFALAASVGAQDISGAGITGNGINGNTIGGGRRTRGSCTAPVTDDNQNGGCGDILELGPSGTFLILPSTTIQNPTFTPSGGAVIEQGGVQSDDVYVSNDGSNGITVVNGMTVGGGASPTGSGSSAGAGSAAGSSKSGNAAPAPTRAPGFELAVAALAAGGVIAAF